MKIALVYNPHAGHKRALKMLPRVEALLTARSVNFDLYLTDYPEHAVEIVRNLDFKSLDGLAAAGGDGTLFEVINGYYQNPSRKRIPLGILPVGTGNAFARDLDLDNTRLEAAIGILAGGKTRRVDVGRFSTHGQEYYYLNILGLGFVADVTQTAMKLKVLGNIAYTLGVLYRTVFLKTHPLTIEIDGKTLERDNLFVEISNSRYTADFLMAPNAKIDDGYLDVTLCNKITRRKLLKTFPKIFTGEHIHAEEIEQFQARSIKVKTGVPKVLTPDGELLGITPIEVDCLEKDIEVFWQ